MYCIISAYLIVDSFKTSPDYTQVRKILFISFVSFECGVLLVYILQKVILPKLILILSRNDPIWFWNVTKLEKEVTRAIQYSHCYETTFDISNGNIEKEEKTTFDISNENIEKEEKTTFDISKENIVPKEKTSFDKSNGNITHVQDKSDKTHYFKCRKGKFSYTGPVNENKLPHGFGIWRAEWSSG
jgi:hypothetical protein